MGFRPDQVHEPNRFINKKGRNSEIATGIRRKWLRTPRLQHTGSPPSAVGSAWFQDMLLYSPRSIFCTVEFIGDESGGRSATSFSSVDDDGWSDDRRHGHGYGDLMAIGAWVE
ncbi:hypothetical protein GQ457_09G023280 [Hibiscus cannabinus]